MKRCWASELKNCSEKLSKEHVISKALFRSNTLKVQGLPWCIKDPIEIGLANLSSHILCQYHNNELSKYDKEAANLMNTIEEFNKLDNIRKKLKPKVWNVKKYLVDGKALERWFLKTTINLCLFQKSNLPIGTKIGENGPTKELVEIAFGLRDFQGDRGLYLAGSVGQKVRTAVRYEFAPIYHTTEKYIAGGLFRFRGLIFIFH